MTRPSQRREMAENAVARHGVSIALACRAFGVSETCYRYSPKLKDENEEIADLLIGLTDARKTWGFGLCFVHLRNVKAQDHATQWLWTYNNDRPNMDIGGITPAQKLKMAA
jgi:transposase InsO family protein